MTIEERNEVIIKYLPVLKKIASRNAAKINFVKNKDLINYVELEELVNMGIFGLVRAIVKYELSDKKISFVKFAYKYVDGSIKNGMIKTINVSNYKRLVYKKIENAVLLLQHEKGRSISYKELAEYLEIDEFKLHKTIKGLSHIWNVSLYRGFYYSQQQEVFDQENIPDLERNDELELREAKSVLRGLVEKLDKKERCVIKLSLYKGMKQCEIANKFKCSANWIHKLRKRALKTLKEYINKINELIEIKKIIIK